MIGLGKMGYRLAENMRDNGHQVVGYDVNEEVVAIFKEEKFEVIESIEELKNIQEKVAQIYEDGKLKEFKNGE